MKNFYKIQQEFQNKLYDLKNFTHEDLTKLSKDFILAAHKELSEVLDCLDWKDHRKEDKTFSKSNLGEELIDVFKYLLNLFVIWDISPKEIEEFFHAKTAVVEQRRKQEFMKASKNEKVCAIDLDDVLNEWHEFFVSTYNRKNKTNYKTDEQIRANEDPIKYSEFKNWWRESGIKRKIPVKKGAYSLTKYLKKKRYRIVIISSRPYKEYFRIFSDTIFWLKENKIEYDDLYFEENKHLKILKHFPNLKFMIEDNRKYAEQVANAGYKVFLLSNNMWYAAGVERLKEKDIYTVSSLEQIKNYV